MNTQRAIVTAGVFSFGMLLIGSSAQAAQWTTTGNSGIANGNQAHVDAQAPINICGNALAVLGSASASCKGGATAVQGGGASGDWTSIANPGIANGNQAHVSAQVPVNFCGNALAVLGRANASCDGGATAGPGHHHPRPHHPTHPYGNHMSPRLQQPTMKLLKPRKTELSDLLKLDQLTGLTSGLLGGAKKPAAPRIAGYHGGHDGGSCGGGDMLSAGNAGIANGNQLHVAPVQVPVNFAGNGLGVLGTASASAHHSSAIAKGGC